MPSFLNFDRDDESRKEDIVRYLQVVLMMLTLATGAEARYLFDAAQVFPLNYVGGMVEAADFTGDGILDVVTARTRLSVMVGAGDGTFSEIIETTGVLLPLSMVVGDLNSDGMMDVVLGDDYGVSDGQLRVLLGSGDGTFYSTQIYSTLENPVDMGLGDLDGDGDLDLVVVDYFTNNGAAQLNDGSGAFGAVIPIPVADGPTRLVLGFFNSDNALDIAMIHSGDGGLRIHPGNGDGTFSSGAVIPLEYGAKGIDSGDFNNDGSPDLAIISSSSYSVLLGDGHGEFSVSQQEYIDFSPDYLGLARMDGDQALDIVLADSSGLIILPGQGNGTFGEGIVDRTAGFRPDVFTLGDLDRDGDPDVIMPATQSYAPGMTVVLNRGDGSLQTADAVDSYSDINWTESVDLDQDGDMDVVMTHDTSSYPDVTALLNDGNGIFSLTDAWSGWQNSAVHFSVGNLNADAIPDLAVSVVDPTSAQDAIEILIGQGDGTFLSSNTYLHDDDVHQSHLWLVNGDAHLDLVVLASDGVWFRPGNGDGSFGSAVNVLGGSNPTLAAGGDLDGNGTLDLVVFNRDGLNFAVSFGNGSGGFSAPVEYSTGNYWFALALGDLDQDGDLDLVYSYDDNPRDLLCVRLNNGTGGFLAETAWPENFDVRQCRLEDVTGDGLLDVLAADGITFSVHPGLGDGGFGDVLCFSGGVYTALPAAGDFDGDGDLDVAVGTWFEDEIVGIFRNTTSLGNLFAAGPGRGENNPPQVRTFTLAGSSVQPVAQWQAYGVSRYGVNVALGELDGSAGMEVLTGAGPGAIFGPHVRGFEDTGVPLPGVSFLAYGTNRWGVNVAAGDIDADGFDEIVTGAGPGAVFGPHVRGWNWDASGTTPTPIPGTSWFAYGTPKWGVNVCCGDIDGDGFDEIVTGAGPGAVYGPHVRGWNCDGGGAVAISAVSFLAYGTNKFGVNVSCGDIDGDGIDEMITGAGPGAVFGPHVRGWNWDGSGTVQAISGISFFAYSSYTEWGANVSCGDLDGDGFDEILTGPGPGETYPARVRGWNYDGSALTAMNEVSFLAFAEGEVTHGVKPAGLRASHR